MELFLASDVLTPAGRAPDSETLSSNGIHDSRLHQRFLPNLGWLETSTVFSRITANSVELDRVAPAPTQRLLAVSVGANTLTAGETLNHIARREPTFTLRSKTRQHSESTSSDITVTAAASSTRVARDQPDAARKQGQRRNPVTGIPTGVASRSKPM